jgi:hypothetical protein
MPLTVADELVTELDKPVVTTGVDAASDAATVTAKSKAMTAPLATNDLVRICAPCSSICLSPAGARRNAGENLAALNSGRAVLLRHIYRGNARYRHRCGETP